MCILRCLQGTLPLFMHTATMELGCERSGVSRITSLCYTNSWYMWAEGECVCMHVCRAVFACGCRIELYCTTSTNTGNVLSLPSICVYSVVVNLFI